MMSSNLLFRIGCALAALGVILGALGAHGPVHDLIAEKGTKRLDNWETAVFYHIIHALALVILSLRITPFRVAPALFILGIILFCGSLYALAVTDIGKLGAITPFGGVCLIAAWILLTFAPLSNSRA